MYPCRTDFMLSKVKRRKLAGKNMKAIISKEIEGSGDSDIDKNAIDSVNNVNCSIAKCEVLDENQKVNDLLIKRKEKSILFVLNLFLLSRDHYKQVSVSFFPL